MADGMVKILLHAVPELVGYTPEQLRPASLEQGSTLFAYCEEILTKPQQGVLLRVASL